MKYNKVLLLSLLLSCLGFTSFGQDCPPNIDFELGNTSVWSYFIGTCCPIVATTSTAPIANRHRLTSGAGTDPYGAFPIVSPGGGSYSLRLGNDSTGRQSEKARYFIPVPATVSNYSLIYRYAVVVQNGGTGTHDATTQPRFEVHAYDSASGTPIACAQFNYNYSSGLPGFTLSTVAGATDVYYKSWTTASINLSGMGGTTIGIDFESGDCQLGGHFGYGYLDMSCGLFSIASVGCDSANVTLTAPDGFNTYTWYDSATFGTVYGGTQTVHIPMPPVTTTYAVVLNPYVGFGCPDTLYTTVRPSHLALHPSHDTTLCFGNPITITSGATDVALPLTYSWSPAAGLSCTTCATPIASPTTNTDYIVTVTNDLGCTKTDTISIRGGHVSVTAGYDSVTCFGGSDGHAFVTVDTGRAPFTYSWSTSPVQTTAITGGVPYNTYMVTVTDSSGCTGTASTTVYQPLPNITAITHIDSPSQCFFSDGSITLNGFNAGDRDTITYLFNGIPQTYIGIVSGAGTITIPSLADGIYTNIGVRGTRCPFNTIPLAILKDPPTPPLPFLNSNAPICAADELDLYVSDGMAGVNFNWTGPNGFTSTLPNPVINPSTLNDSGYYVVTVERLNCRSKDSVWVTIHPIPLPFAGNNAPFCAGGDLMLTSGSTNGSTYYSWAGPNAFSSTLQNPTLTNVNETYSGIYTVTVLLYNCRATATTSATIYPIPGIPAVSDTSYCQYAVSLPLHATGTNILWYADSTGGTGSTVAPTPSTAVPGVSTWYVNQTSPQGCIGPRTIIRSVVAPYPSPSVTQSDSTICSGTNVTYHVINPGIGNTGLAWSFGGTDSARDYNPLIHGYTTPGTYPISVTAFYDICPDTTMYLTLKVYSTPELNLGLDTTICDGSNSIQLYDLVNAGNLAASWLWNTGETTSNIMVSAAGTYYSTVTINGCTATDTVNVMRDCYMEIPNVFSPNGDGLNDYFFPRQYLTRGLSAFKMEIFNRWGELIFSTNSTEGLGWDGRYNGEMQPQGVFIYKMDATFKDGKKEHHSGNVTLMR